jgi:hypothetical protein
MEPGTVGQEVGVFTIVFGLMVILAVAVRHRNIALPLLVGYLLRVTVALGDVYIVGFSRKGDGFWWDFWADQWARDGLAGTLQHIDTGHFLYIWMMSAAYAVAGRSPLMIQALNALFGTLIVLYASRLALEISGDEGRARRAAWLVSVFPTAVVHSALLLREVAVTLPLVIGAYHLSAWLGRRTVRHLIVAVAAVLVSMVFHSGSVGVLVAAAIWVLANWVRSVVRLRTHRLLADSIAAAAVVAVAVAVVSTNFGLDKFKGTIDSQDFGVVSAVLEPGTKGRTQYLQDLVVQTPSDLIWQTPIRLAYFLFAPFPWMVSSAVDGLGLVDSAFFVWVAARFVRLRAELRGNTIALPVLGSTLVMALVFSMGVTNVGTAIRHRSKMLPILAATVVALGEPRVRARRQQNRRTNELAVGASAPLSGHS